MMRQSPIIRNPVIDHPLHIIPRNKPIPNGENIERQRTEVRENPKGEQKKQLISSQKTTLTHNQPSHSEDDETVPHHPMSGESTILPIPFAEKTIPNGETRNDKKRQKAKKNRKRKDYTTTPAPES